MPPNRDRGTWYRRFQYEMLLKPGPENHELDSVQVRTKSYGAFFFCVYMRKIDSQVKANEIIIFWYPFTGKKISEEGL